MKRIKKLLIVFLIFTIYTHAGDTVPTESTVTVSGSSGTNEFGNIISGDKTAVKIGSWVAQYGNDGIISGTNENGVYASPVDSRRFRLDNNGTITSENVGVNLHGTNTILDNNSSGVIFGSIFGLNINGTIKGSSELYDEFSINNWGTIQSDNIAVNLANDNRTVNINNIGLISGRVGISLKDKPIYIYNNGSGIIEGSESAIITPGGTITNHGLIQNSNGNLDAIQSSADLTLKGNGEYKGNITYTGTDPGVLTLEGGHSVYTGALLKSWNDVIVDGGAYAFDTDAANTTIKNSAIAYIGQSSNLQLIGSDFSPHNNAEKGAWENGGITWNPDAVLAAEYRQYKLTQLKTLKVDENSAVNIDFKDSKGKPTDTMSQGNGNLNYAHDDVWDPHFINYDEIRISGDTTIDPGATLNLIDHTTLAKADAIDIFQINPFSSEVKTTDFDHIVVYSDLFNVQNISDTGIITFTSENYDPYTQSNVLFWLNHLSPTSVKDWIEYNPSALALTASPELEQKLLNTNTEKELSDFLDSINKVEYASLATSNLNMISNRVGSMYDRLGSTYVMRDANNYSAWVDVYYSDDSLTGIGDHGIDGQGTEFAVGFDKLINDKLIVGLSFNHNDYTSTVNDSGIHTDIDSEGYGLNLYTMYDQGNLRHKAMIGYARYNNTGDDFSSFNSSEMFASYRAEYSIRTKSCEITPLIGLRYSKVQFDQINDDSDNGLRAFNHDSLESELGVKISRQFKKLKLHVDGAWMHELLDTENSATAFTSFGEFEQNGIERDSDSFRLGVGAQYQITEKITFDIGYQRGMSSNSESNSLNGKLTFKF